MSKSNYNINTHTTAQNNHHSNQENPNIVAHIAKNNAILTIQHIIQVVEERNNGTN